MKTIEQIDREIQEILKDFPNGTEYKTTPVTNKYKATTESNRATKRLKFLKQAKDILIFEATEDSIKRQIEKTEDQLRILDERFPAYERPPGYNGNLRTRYNRETGYTAKKKAIEVYKYLLS